MSAEIETVKTVKQGQLFTLTTKTGKATFTMQDKRQAKCETIDGLIDGIKLTIGSLYKLRPRLIITKNQNQ